MLNTPMDVLTQFPVRKTKAQKDSFRNEVCAWARKQGYCVTVEKGSFGTRNIVMGDPEGANYLVTAHYDTPARLLFPNFLTPMNPAIYLLKQVMLCGMILLLAVPITIAAALIFGEGAMAPTAFFSVLGIYGLMLLGPANQNNANDNTSGVVTVLEIMRSLTEDQQGKVCFVLFDLEEAGLIGSRSYRKMHKTASDRQLVLNLDCVGDGDVIRMFPTKKLKKDRKKLTSLYKACGYFGKKSILVHEKGFSVYPSDQKHFPFGVGICALKKSKFGLYLGRIHTKKDTVLEMTNINLLRAALTTFISGDAAL